MLWKHNVIRKTGEGLHPPKVRIFLSPQLFDNQHVMQIIKYDFKIKTEKRVEEQADNTVTDIDSVSARSRRCASTQNERGTSRVHTKDKKYDASISRYCNGV